jgi:hypothetical protein
MFMAVSFWLRAARWRPSGQGGIAANYGRLELMILKRHREAMVPRVKRDERRSKKPVLQCSKYVLLAAMTNDSPDLHEPDLTATIFDFTPVPLQRNRANGWTPLTQRRFIHALSVMGSVAITVTLYLTITVQLR